MPFCLRAAYVGFGCYGPSGRMLASAIGFASAAGLATCRNGPTGHMVGFGRRFGYGHRFGYGRRLMDLWVEMLGNVKVKE